MKIILFIISSFLLSLILIGLSYFVFYELIDRVLWNTNTEVFVVICIMLSIYPSYLISKKDAKKFLDVLLNSTLFLGLVELIVPTFFSLLFKAYVESIELYQMPYLIVQFVCMFYFVLLFEWLRRYREEAINSKYIRYVYLIIMAIVFIMGIWYAEMAQN